MSICFAFTLASSTLKQSDVNQIMEQILEEHLGDKEVTTQLIQKALLKYINQFDPQKIYLLQSEVDQFNTLPEKKLAQALVDYRNHNFQIFLELNEVIQKSILRARQIKESLTPGEIKNIQTDINPNTFALNEKNLKLKIIKYLATSGSDLTAHEDEYIFVNNENFFLIHVLKSLSSSLDAHTSFVEASEAQTMRLNLQKELIGIGLEVKKKGPDIVVSKVYANSPASKKNISKNDSLIAINGQSVANLSEESVKAILSNNLDEVKIIDFKRGDTSLKVALKPDLILVEDSRVDASYEKFNDGIIGVIKLHSFYQGKDISSETDVENAILNLKKIASLEGLILDLRDNRGGFLNQAVKVAGLFITNGVVVVSQYADGHKKLFRDLDSKVSFSGPMVVLTSKITASAAEIVAGALQDYGVALVVGDAHTYGKGTIQTQTITSNNDSPYFKVTVGMYYTPSGKTPQKEGVKVDILVPGQWQYIEVGEKYASSVSSNRIENNFDDPLNDIKSELKPWYFKYYIPKIQHRSSYWRNYLPTLSAKSEDRIKNSDRYQLLIDEAKKKKSRKYEVQWEAKKSNVSSKIDEMQLKEALNIVQDMILLDKLEKRR